MDAAIALVFTRQSSHVTRPELRDNILITYYYYYMSSHVMTINIIININNNNKSFNIYINQKCPHTYRHLKMKSSDGAKNSKVSANWPTDQHFSRSIVENCNRHKTVTFYVFLKYRQIIHIKGKNWNHQFFLNKKRNLLPKKSEKYLSIWRRSYENKDFYFHKMIFKIESRNSVNMVSQLFLKFWIREAILLILLQAELR